MSNYPPQYAPPGQPQQPYGQQPPPQEGGGCFSCMGCGLITLVVLLLVCGGGGIYVYYNFGGWVADFAAGVLKKVVNDSKLSPEQKQKINQQVDRVTTAYKAGKIDQAKLKQFADEMQASPLVPAIVAAGADAQYISPSGLSDEEKEEARKTMARVMTGALQESISKDKVESLMNKIQEPGPNGQKKLKEHLSDEDLKEFLADAKELADQANVPEDVPMIDYANELKKIVDKVLGPE
jgi:hypothetical protein